MTDGHFYPQGHGRCFCGAPDCDQCSPGWNPDKCHARHRSFRGKHESDEECSDCDHDECELWAEEHPKEEEEGQ